MKPGIILYLSDPGASEGPWPLHLEMTAKQSQWQFHRTKIYQHQKMKTGKQIHLVVICYLQMVYLQVELPGWLSGKESTGQCRRCRRCWFDLWVRKSPWRRKWQPIPVFLPGNHMVRGAWQANSPWGCKESDRTEQLNVHAPFISHHNPS